MRALSTVGWIVTAVLSLGLASAAGGAQFENTTLKLDTEMGGALPTKNGVSLVNVDCFGAKGSRCQGTIRLLPRGAKTRGLVGPAPIARASTTLVSPDTKALRLRLSQRAVAAIKGNTSAWLSVTIEVRSNGKRRTHPAVIDDFRPVLGHKSPSSIRALRLHRRGGSGATVTRYDWKWDIPVRSFLVIPEFRCPGGEGSAMAAGTRRDPYWIQARLEARAAEGTGYGNFRFSSRFLRQGVEGQYRAYYVMRGWPKGGWTTNSVWAPALFKDGHFELTAWCTNSADRGEIARITQGDGDDVSFMPWSN